MQFNYQKYGKMFNLAIINDATEKTYNRIFKNLKLLFPNTPNFFITHEDFSIISTLNNMYLDSMPTMNNGSSLLIFHLICS